VALLFQPRFEAQTLDLVLEVIDDLSIPINRRTEKVNYRGREVVYHYDHHVYDYPTIDAQIILPVSRFGGVRVWQVTVGLVTIVPNLQYRKRLRAAFEERTHLEASASLRNFKTIATR